MEVKVNKLKPEEIFKTDKEEVRKSNSSQKVGKLKLEANIFENQNSGETPNKSPEIKVGKIDAENIFRARTPEDPKEERRNSLKVGKLDRNVWEPSSDERAAVRRLTADDLFRPAEEASRELLTICKPGKLSGDQLRISSNIGKTQPRTGGILLYFTPISQAVTVGRTVARRLLTLLWFPRAKSPNCPVSWRAPPGPGPPLWVPPRVLRSSGGQRATSRLTCRRNIRARWRRTSP